MASVAALGCV